MIAEFSAALTALKETTGLVKVISDAKTDAEIKAATFELQNKLLAIQSDCFILGDAIRSRDEEVMLLKAKVAEFEEFKSQTEGYVLNNLESGTFVYSKKQIVGDTETTVHLCPQCFTKKVISILQPTGEPAYNSHTNKYYFQSRCHSCTSLFPMNVSAYKPVW
ncbi:MULTISPECIES: hypothetical protein [Buttiauxella]|uniref:Uncharacterized protein n=1 Tax=Buttiauxella izardii TaxID=82991 RepID=A0A3A5K2P1_9ENTR|nr:hypothetical protein [Buttiauxella izardii]RJT26889.1 hypothetical protein D6029_03630 [Buttiauxella izardii]